MTTQITLENGNIPSKEEYVIAISRLVNYYTQSDPLCSKAMLEELGYSSQAIENILHTAHAVTVRNS